MEFKPRHDDDDDMKYTPTKKTRKTNELETLVLLQLVAKKLEAVGMNRYIMLHKARLEEACRGNYPENVKKDIDWYHFSQCPKKYVL